MDRSNDADRVRKLAEDARATAKAVASLVLRTELLAIAANYERLAELAERTAGRKGERWRG
jgi:hypothetical protein